MSEMAAVGDAARGAGLQRSLSGRVRLYLAVAGCAGITVIVSALWASRGRILASVTADRCGAPSVEVRKLWNHDAVYLIVEWPRPRGRMSMELLGDYEAGVPATIVVNEGECTAHVQMGGVSRLISLR